MVVYNLNRGIGWASSGVEYAQAYRSEVFRKLGVEAKFIFTDMFQNENIEHLTRNIGFEDNEIIWLYTFFTDLTIAATSYSLQQLKESFSLPIDRTEKNGKIISFFFKGSSIVVTVMLNDESSNIVQRVEYLMGGKLVRKDYYSYTKMFSEYYAPEDTGPCLYQRTFYNEDGSVAYEENVDGENSIFKFKETILYSKEELVGYMLEKLQLTNSDLILLDRSTGIGQAVLRNKGNAKVAVVVHAEHYNVSATDETTILWNNYYDYQFSNADSIDAFITSTETQTKTLIDQFKKYLNIEPVVYTIPVGSLSKLQRKEWHERKAFSLLTCSRLASEKHIDWLINAVVEANKVIPELTFDIYGEGGERQKLQEIIAKNKANNYIRLMGHKNLSSVYKDYQVYLSGSTSEGFGLTLMEAIGSGLPIIGLDVPYGNQTFIENNLNGYLIPRETPDNPQQISTAFAQYIVALFNSKDICKKHEYSYRIASRFLNDKIIENWSFFLRRLLNDYTI
ncbi:TPA: accessory Sec system glycosyltransferase GtfA [Streptococcus agalactiae]|nr:accessory Sec system glycosyltransferase GtfA [Streptococcus agalactiae]